MKVRSLSVCVLGLAFLGLCACSLLPKKSIQSQSSASQSEKLTVEQTVQAVFTAMKDADTEKLNQLTEYPDHWDGPVLFKDNKLFGKNADEEEKQLLKSIFSGISCEIEKVSEAHGSATVQAEVTGHDFSGIGSDLVSNANAADPLAEALKRYGGKMVTSQVQIKLLQKNGIWKMETDETFARALLLGGKSSADLKLPIIKK